VGRVGNRYVWQGGQTEIQGGQTKKIFGASRRILPTLAWNPAGAPGVLGCRSGFLNLDFLGFLNLKSQKVRILGFRFLKP